jgi:hypothetical protein
MRHSRCQIGKLRGRLLITAPERPLNGESLATLQKFDVPLAQATTSTLEALKHGKIPGG